MTVRKILAILGILAMCAVATPVASSAQAVRSESIVTIEGRQYYVHTVAKGETLYALSRAYGVAEDEITGSNPHAAGGLQAGMVLKIPVKREPGRELNRRQMKRTFDVHTVAEGETSYAIARKYGIAISQLQEDNPDLDPLNISPGQKINIRKSSRGDTSGWQITEELEEYRDAMNSLTTDGRYHLVKKDETLYGIAKMFGVTVGELEAANDLRDGLKAGAMIKIPGKPAAGTGADGMPQEESGRPAFESAADSVAWLREEARRQMEEDGIRIRINDISSRREVNISLLLPFEDEDRGRLDRRYLEFYRGVLLGLEDLKQQGVSANLNVFNTSQSGGRMVDIVTSREFRETDLIIGPVYESGLLPVVTFAERNGVPVVSPLQIMEGMPSPVLFQMAPSSETKYDKLKQLLSQPDINVVYITTADSDREMDDALRDALPPDTKHIQHSGSMSGSALESRLDRRAAENIIVVSCTNPRVVDQILGTISSVHSNLVARSLMGSKIKVVGNARWARFPSATVDRELYFKLGVCYVANYHADRTDGLVREFDRRYILAFGETPSQASPYAYRGYDAAKLFAGAAMTQGSDYAWKVNGSNQTLLQVGYHLEQRSPDADFRNKNWVMVCYGPDYTITVK